METVFFTAPGTSVMASSSGIYFPDVQDLVPQPISVARSGELKPENFSELISKYKSGEEVNLAGNGQLRFGCSFAIKVNGNFVFSKFSDSHPTQANKITPPGGLFTNQKETPQEAAFRELSEEILFSFTSHRLLRAPSLDNVVITSNILKYAQEYNYTWSPEFIFPVKIVEPAISTKVYFGDKCYEVGVTFEEKVGSIELIWFGEATLYDQCSRGLLGLDFLDGEILPNGQFRGSKPVSEGYENYPMTEKAKFVLGLE